MIPQFSASDYLNAFLGCLPPGRAWPRTLSSALARVCGGITPAYARNNTRAAALVVDAFPKTTVELLPEWELSLGLPDACETDTPTLQSRQAAVLARFTAAGGQSAQYYIDVAAALGYAITITEFAPFRVGISRVGDAVCGPDWSHVWQVNAPQFTIQSFRVGQSAVGEPLRWWGNTALQCTLRRISPADKILTFSYI